MMTLRPGIRVEWLGLLAMLIGATFLNINSTHAEEAMCDLAYFDSNCEIGCPDGYLNDENGCPTCECHQFANNQPLTCDASVTCPQRCEDYVTDENGCATCQCSTTLSKVALDASTGLCDVGEVEKNCEIGCPNGYKHDGKGCQVCECHENRYSKCPSLGECPVKCIDYVVDDSNCVTCDCADIEAVDRAKADEQICDLVDFYASCEVGCPLGYQNDDDGCPVCDCWKAEYELSNGCPNDLVCPTKCEDYIVDEDGCFTCDCSD